MEVGPIQSVERSVNHRVVSDSVRPMDCSPPGSSVHGILQARVLEWVAISSSRGSSQPSNWTQISHISGRLFTDWATRKRMIPLKKRHVCPQTTFRLKLQLVHGFQAANPHCQIWTYKYLQLHKAIPMSLSFSLTHTQTHTCTHPICSISLENLD